MRQIFSATSAASHTMHHDVFERGLTHQLAVIAVNENYFDYCHRTSDVFTTTGPVMYLEGGIGMFGSVVTVATRTIVVR
jgi:hypothetical protein